MGNCLNNNQRYARPPPPSNYNTNQRWAPNIPVQPQQVPRSHFNTYENPLGNNLQEQEEPDLLEIPNIGQTPNKYLHRQSQLNPAALFHKYQAGCSQNFYNSVFVKVPINKQETSYQTVTQPLWIFPPQIAQFSLQQMKGSYFQQKMTWFRFQVERLRVDWQLGCQTMKVDRHNVLMSSINQLQAINLKKELKIKFDQEEVDDAGGVLREWMHIAIKQIFNFQISGLLRLCDNDQKCYRFVLDLDQSQQEKSFRILIARLLGIIIGKALFQRISLNCFLTKSIWRQICGKPVPFGDFYFYDKAIYLNLKILKQHTCDSQLGLFFNYSVSQDNKSTKLINLKPKGDQIPVTDKNKNQFVELLIKQFCVATCSHYIAAIKEGINKVFPCNLLQIFQPQQIEMMLNGPQFIDVRQWKASTLYKNCSQQNTLVQWFWRYVEALDQEKLGNLLHYITGSRRLPILGFFYLQSNRNQINRFTIQKVAYDKGNPYPKGHTCFNRLELPEYSTQKELVMRMTHILTEQIHSFGLS